MGEKAEGKSIEAEKEFPKVSEVLEVAGLYASLSVEFIADFVGDVLIANGIGFEDGFLAFGKDVHAQEKIINDKIGGDGRPIVGADGEAGAEGAYHGSPVKALKVFDVVLNADVRVFLDRDAVFLHALVEDIGA